MLLNTTFFDHNVILFTFCILCITIHLLSYKPTNAHTNLLVCILENDRLQMFPYTSPKNNVKM